LQEKLLGDARIQVLWDSVPEEIIGDTFVTQIRLRNVKTNKETVIDVSGVFVSVGAQPATGYLKGLLNLDTVGAIVTDDKLETNVPGIFAAGDIRSGSIRQVIGAAGDGAVAAVNAGKYLSE
jgi:thioredoxin reductase (NADPH)